MSCAIFYMVTFVSWSCTPSSLQLMGAHREAEAVLEAAMELEVDEINSHLCKLEMQQTLEKLQKRGRGRKPTA